MTQWVYLFLPFVCTTKNTIVAIPRLPWDQLHHRTSVWTLHPSRWALECLRSSLTMEQVIPNLVMPATMNRSLLFLQVSHGIVSNCFTFIGLFLSDCHSRDSKGGRSSKSKDGERNWWLGLLYWRRSLGCDRIFSQGLFQVMHALKYGVILTHIQNQLPCFRHLLT